MEPARHEQDDEPPGSVHFTTRRAAVRRKRAERAAPGFGMLSPG